MNKAERNLLAYLEGCVPKRVDTNPAAQLEHSRVQLGRALMHFVLQRLPDNYTYSSAALNKLVLDGLERIDKMLDELHAAEPDEE